MGAVVAESSNELVVGTGQTSAKSLGNTYTQLMPLATKSLGDWGEARLADYLGGQGIKPKGAFRTPFGPRFADRVLNGISYESKAGSSVKMSTSIARQIAKDSYLVKSGLIRGAEWHIWRGAEPEVIDALEDAGIDYVLH